MTAPLRTIGVRAPRADSPEKVSGRVRYAVDVTLPGLLHVKVLRSPRAHATIARLDTETARSMPGVCAVLTEADIPAHFMPVYGYFIKDQPIVADSRVRYVGDIVCAIAAVTEAQAAAALAAVKVEHADLPVAATVEAALAADAEELFPAAPFGVAPARPA
jgi:CO/xanthine dehydrogenase Mo-binding subunit